MVSQVQTSLMTGGLDLMTPAIAIPPGRAIAAVNYEPDVAGYTSHGGFERFDGSPRPSDVTDPALVAERRDTIRPVPGVDTVRGVWVYKGNVYAFRDQASGFAGMFRSGAGGWESVPFGQLLEFADGTAEFIIGEYVIGLTTGALGHIDRVVLREGAWDGTASGYLIVSQVSGSFGIEPIESNSGAANGLTTTQLVIMPGGRYDFTVHNFYGAAQQPCLYFANGTDTAFEFNGSVLVPIRTGVSDPADLSGITALHAALAPISAGEEIFAADGSQIVMSTTFDAPVYITHYQNHLWLGFTAGTLIHSSLGQPIEYITTTGAGEMSFGQPLTGLLTAASTSLVAFAANRIDYVTGADASEFRLNPISEKSGAQPYTAQETDQPIYLDDGGVRALNTTPAFGDWRMGTMTQLIETLVRKKRDSGVDAVASMVVKGKDQYKLFWSDMTGITVYRGRKNPEAIPFRLPVQVYCACAGEVEQGEGDRLFVGCQDGFVYEMNRGTSFDGAPIDSYIRLPFSSAGSPMQETRWQKVSFELSSPDDITIGVAFDVDYARGLGGVPVEVPVDAGAAIITTEDYPAVDWTQAVAGRLEYHLNGIGPNIATTLIHSSATARPHTISSQTYNFSRRRLKR